MAVQDRTSYADFLKEQYPSNLITPSFYDKTLLLSQIERARAEMQGKQMVYFIRAGRNFQGGPRAEGAVLPTVGRQTAEQITFAPKYDYQRFGISGPVMAASRRNGSPTEALNYEVINAVRDARFRISQLLYRSSAGEIARVTAAGTSVTTITVDDTTHVAVDQPVAIATRSTGTIITSGAQSVTAKTATTLTFGTAVTVATTDSVYLTGGAAAAESLAWKKAIYGLDAIVDERNPSSLHAGLTNYGGIDRSVAAGNFFKGNRLHNSGTLRSLTEDLMHQARQLANSAGGGDTNLIICGDAVFRAYGKLLTPDRRFPVSAAQKFAGGYTALDFCGIPVVDDPICLPNKMFFLDTSTFTWLVEQDFDWINEDGNMLARSTGSSAVHEFEACLWLSANLACKNPAANTKLEDIQ